MLLLELGAADGRVSEGTFEGLGWFWFMGTGFVDADTSLRRTGQVADVASMRPGVEVGPGLELVVLDGFRVQV